MNLFRAPIVRSASGAAAALDRALFSKKVDLAAARVADPKNIAKYRKALESSKDILRVDRVSAVVPDPDPAARRTKCLLLKPEIRPGDPETWGPVLRQAVQEADLRVIPYELKLDYDYWTYHDVMASVLPEELHDDIPSGFNTVGHVAHLNLRDRFLPYKKLVGEVLLDKNPQIRTVINKTHNVGTESEYRTFEYEVLAGPDDLDVEVAEAGCVFRFDYAKVYWNSKLETEHRRLVALFEPGHVVCDAMAGIGPFAVPAGKKGVFVWANDMNPQSYNGLRTAIEVNKVSQFVRPFNEDGRTFIKKAADSVLEASRNGETAVVLPPLSKRRRHRRGNSEQQDPDPNPKRVPLPPTISHFVMNLPASALTFLGCYRGLYAGSEALFSPHTSTPLPLVHAHCFSVKGGDDGAAAADICERITAELGVSMRPGDDPDVEGQVALHDVRDVAPAKRMFCATFRLPRQVAFAAREGQ